MSISPTFFEQLLRRYSCAKNKTKNASTKKLCAKLSFENAAPKMLVKLTTERTPEGGQSLRRKITVKSDIMMELIKSQFHQYIMYFTRSFCAIMIAMILIGFSSGSQTFPMGGII
jgi:hypothetical protein